MPLSHTTTMIPNPPLLEQQSLLQLNVLKGASNVVKNSTLLGRAALPIKEFTQVGYWSAAGGTSLSTIVFLARQYAYKRLTCLSCPLDHQQRPGEPHEMWVPLGTGDFAAAAGCVSILLRGERGGRGALVSRSPCTCGGVCPCMTLQDTWPESRCGVSVGDFYEV